MILKVIPQKSSILLELVRGFQGRHVHFPLDIHLTKRPFMPFCHPGTLLVKHWNIESANDILKDCQECQIDFYPNQHFCTFSTFRLFPIHRLRGCIGIADTANFT